MGHVLNKVLKDIVNRYKIMQGYNVRYAKEAFQSSNGFS
jgi:isoleucyl-tRNA synthetase